MKRSMKAVVALMLTVAMMACATGCKKNNDGNGIGNHEYVDLDLPSGTQWATCNVGAVNPWESGYCFAWGETERKDTYSWETYKYGSLRMLTKYCNNSDYGYNGYTDNLTTLQAMDDAATANWGSGWHTPTKEQLQELYGNTSHAWTTRNNVEGMEFYANGTSLFLPAPTSFSYNYVPYWIGQYWLASLYMDNPNLAWIFYFGADNPTIKLGQMDRKYGYFVRPVRSAK